MRNDEAGEKRIFVRTDYAGSVWLDKLGNMKADVIINEDGHANFPVGEGSVSVYLKRV